jgi:hypothetical protein
MDRNAIHAGLRATLDQFGDPSLTGKALQRIEALTDDQITVEAVGTICRAVWEDALRDVRTQAAVARAEAEAATARLVAAVTVKATPLAWH